MKDSIIYYGLVTFIGLSSVLIVASLNSRDRVERRQKVKGKIWRDLLRDIEAKLNRPEVNPGSPGNLEVIRIELRIVLEDYIRSHPSQTNHYKPFIKRLKKVRDKPYPRKIQAMREILRELKQPIH
jgi:hypothetical protein